MADEPPIDLEFEREPVPERARLGFRSFLGQYISEHVAGTELMIGPLFLRTGVTAADLVLGLLVGNALAVLSWLLVTAPIATRVRLTLYSHLERLCGRKLVTLYNLANGVMFCFLAGSMITVSATAAGVWTGIEMPSFADTLPNGAGWIATSLVVGVLIAVIAAAGYRAVARFGALAAPWMILVFLAFGIVGLSQLGVTHVSQIWEIATTKVFPGGAPRAGSTQFTFWQVCFFAWFCNLAMHLGMADLSVFRFAKKSRYAIASGAGMYVGHCMAWLAAAILYAVQLARDPTNEDVLPGPMADSACGVAGLVCVIVAGWTTANPTIYRAGLAFQAIVPKVSRFKVTLFAGAVATVAGLFPAVAMKLLGFVAFYGMVLMPMGAVIVADYWLLPRLGLQSWWAMKRGLEFYGAAGLTWLLTLASCAALVQWGGVEIYFVSLPGWVLAGLLYTLLSAVWQRRDRQRSGVVMHAASEPSR
ncbi:MAG: hypothetical protein EXS13_10130 [Planctomycetes bacterium]|nr:hypothetical protein [Planctomycetota bacterium]